jgi:hypothetical protein
MPLRTYLERLMNEDRQSKDYYLAVQNIKQNFPDLAADVELPVYVRNEKIHRGPFLWIGFQYFIFFTQKQKKKKKK